MVEVIPENRFFKLGRTRIGWEGGMGGGWTVGRWTVGRLGGWTVGRWAARLHCIPAWRSFRQPSGAWVEKTVGIILLSLFILLYLSLRKK